MKSIFKIVSVTVAVFMMLQSVSFLVMDAAFNLNRAHIASAFCVNRDKPLMHCDGKCFLKKELSKQQQDQSNNQKSVTLSFSLSFFIEKEFAHYHFSSLAEIFFLPAQSKILKGYPETAERPPTC